MRIKITSGGIYDGEGKEVPIGAEFTVKEEPTAWAGRYSVIGAEGGKSGTPKKAAKKAEDEGDGDATYTAAERDGAWVIADADGNVIGKPLTADDAKAFNDLSDEDKAAFVTEHAKV